jgi:cobalt-zinc-cadmium efflux system protein
MSDHQHHHHHHGQGRTLMWSFALTAGFALVEGVGGWWAGSLALFGDAGHMLSDATALGFATVAASYGLGRAEVVAAIVNSLLMVAVVVAIAIAAVMRLRTPVPVEGGTVMGIAFTGLVINLAVAWILSRGEHTLNTRAALIHVMGDLLGSLAALSAGAVVYFTGWTPIDPILSLVICALILYTALRLLREALHVIMEGVPLDIDLREVGQAMAATQGVTSVHDLHIWTLSSGQVVLSAHVIIPDMTQWQEILTTLRELIHRRFDIDHVTLQPEPAGHGSIVHVPVVQLSRH